MSLEQFKSPFRSEAPGMRMLRRIFRNRSAQIGGILLFILISITYAAPLLTYKKPNKTEESDILGPSEAFRHQLDYFSHTKHVRAMIEKLAAARLLRALGESLAA